MFWPNTDLRVQLLVLGILCLALFKLLNWSRSLPFPPGPSPLPILGNIKDLPKEKPWLVYTEWAKKYGPLIHFRVFNQHVMVINSLEVAGELLNKRSASSSDRPIVPMIALTGSDFNFSLIGNTETWRKCRRIAQQAFRPDVIVDYQHIQIAKTHDFLRAFLEDPQNWVEHNRRLSGAITMATLYGYDIAPKNDYFISVAEHAIANLSEALFPGACAVNTLPILQYFPEWFPGCGFHRLAAETRELTAAMCMKPFEFVKRNMETNTGKPCLVRTLLETNETRSMEGIPEEETDVLQKVAATSFAGGADTTVAALGTFMLAMVLYPDVAAKAQEQLDRVVGRNRLPTLDDQRDLPYIEAIVREVFRFRPVFPLGIPHTTTEDDVYEGQYIPKGCVFWPNVWAMSRDESIYPDPEVFNPDRFFNPDGTLNDDDVIFTFGFGRRICVGRHLAQATMFLAIASFLSTFNITKAKDVDGNDVPVVERYSDGVVAQPHSFECSITPRSAQAVALISEEVAYGDN
ncbi:cytochrome P450 [Mycena floridula]|nr:cytochrome P450 [Mycena floridula]